MAMFQKALDFILMLEGGFSDNQNDRGGQTAFGISQKFLDRIGYPIPARHLTIDNAEEIYKEYFWENNLFREILDQRIANKIFEICIHFDFNKAIQLVQQACNQFLPDKDKLIVDGVFGSKTLEAINKITPPYKLVEAIRDKQIERYNLIVLRNPTQRVFLKGWLNRAMKA